MNAERDRGGLRLGIDIGTTKAAAVLFDAGAEDLVDLASEPTNADLPAQGGRHEQSPERIFETVERLVRSLSPDAKSKVSAIGLTGQMHGVVLSGPGGRISPLATWKDARASGDGSLSRINSPPGCEGLKDGFGLTTLAWLSMNGGLDGWTGASTIHDLFAARLCSLPHPVCDPSDAASWGLFDIHSGQWDAKALEALRIPPALLPGIVPAGSKIGVLSKPWADRLGLAPGIPVAAPAGDNQASILATAKEPDKEIFLTVGTGAQLSVAVKAGDALARPSHPGMELRPFFDGRLLAVAAPLCGGQSFAWLIRSAAEWMRSLGVEAPPEAELYQRIDALAMRSPAGALRVRPNFLGERHTPALRGEISQISLDNFTIGDMAASLAEGIMLNMRSMMPDWAFEGRERLVASGNALRRLGILQAKAREVFKAPLELSDSKEEAACGAALIASRLA